MAAAPCIVFIDEIDAGGLGEKSEGSAKHPHDPQPALTELDGFRKNEGVIVLAATNTPETLDKALVRPGRFDRRWRCPTRTWTAADRSSPRTPGA